MPRGHISEGLPGRQLGLSLQVRINEVRGSGAAERMRDIDRQRLVDEPVEQAVPIGGVRDDVPALVACVRCPCRYDGITEGVDEDGMKLALWCVVDACSSRRPA